MGPPDLSLRVQIDQIDYTLAQPGPLDNSTLPKVPIIRVYGPTSLGKKACVHIHQVYPYFFVEYAEKMDPESVNRYIYKLLRSLNHAIAISMKRNPDAPSSQFVRAIILVKGVHFYGFHSSWSPFLKILMGDPALVHRAVTILRSGTIMQTRFRIFESHLSFILQFMSDFGLYGCGWMELGEVLFRGSEYDDGLFDPGTAPSEKDSESMQFESSPHFRQSRMPLEVDTAAHQILNRYRLSIRNIHHKLEIPAPPLPDEPVVLGVRELWEDERNRRIAKGLSPSPEMPVDPSEGSREPGGDWVAEARWWDELNKRIEREMHEEAFVQETNTWERWAMSTFESIEALWDDKWRVWKPRVRDDNEEATEPTNISSNPYSPASGSSSWDHKDSASQESVDVDVDETKLSSQEIGLHIDGDEETWDVLRKGGNALAEDQNKQIFDDEDDLPPDLEQEDQEQEDEEQDQPRTPEHQDGLREENDRGSRIRDEGPTSLSEPGLHTKSQKMSLSAAERIHIQNVPTKFSEDNGELRPIKKAKIGLQTDLVLGTPSDPATSPSSHPTERSYPTPLFSPIPVSEWNTLTFVYARQPPLASELLSSMDTYGLPMKIYRNPYYSKTSDAPERPREYAGLIYRLKGGNGLAVLEPWDDGTGTPPKVTARQFDSKGIGGWEFDSIPPSAKVVRSWMESDGRKKDPQKKAFQQTSQIGGPTQTNPYGLKYTPVSSSEQSSRQRQNMSVLSLEVFACTRGIRKPDPEVDEINAVFYAFQSSDIDPSGLFACDISCVVVESVHVNSSRMRDFDAEVVSSELDLLNRIADIVCDLDPDLIVGWEVQTSSWGYLTARGQQYGYEIPELISRAPKFSGSPSHDEWGLRKTSTLTVTGRHVLNLWRIIRSEQNLNVYSFENAVFHVLHRRVPKYNPETLTRWYCSDVPAHTAKVLRHFSERSSMVLEILNEIDMVTKTAEFARVFGVDFFSVISRGSQFKVESFMSRIAKPESFVLLSPSKQDVGKQNAAECMPLILEPLSAFYNSPLLVLDFQSLYPSVMVAYNYCYSTCLGRAVDYNGRNKFGVTELNQPPGLLKTLTDFINVAPNGIIYVKKEVRQGLLGRMLTELLNTRVMVKQAMKGVKTDKALRKILDARQLGLKFIANVTYGYTSATFSGRMPAVEIADSIVQSGRETLEKAIRIIDSTKKWGAKVVYGDTDSVFVYLRGKTKDQAFKIGYDIADAITRANPAPIKLKFEKVYLPCVLMAKKRYVGFKYETPDDKEPVFDAKGIETVRRDGVPAQQKMTETCLKILFRTQDLSQVKEYCWSSWTKILENKASVQDFVFAKEVRMGTYSDRVPPPPGVMVAARRMTEDENDEPHYGERIPYVITRGAPNSRLVDRAVTPEELLNNRHLHIDAVYYITRVLIPPLERIFNLVGADVRGWYDEMPKSFKVDHVDIHTPTKDRDRQGGINRFKIDEHFRSSHCIACGCLAFEGLCDICRSHPQETISGLLHELQIGEKRILTAQRICASCTSTGTSEPIECVSIDCPWFFERKRLEDRMDFMLAVENRIQSLNKGASKEVE